MSLGHTFRGAICNLYTTHIKLALKTDRGAAYHRSNCSLILTVAAVSSVSSVSRVSSGKDWDLSDPGSDGVYTTSAGDLDQDGPELSG